jgi:hypothetical protein
MRDRNEVDPASPYRRNIVSETPSYERGIETNLEVSPSGRCSLVVERSLEEVLVLLIRHVLGLPHPERSAVIDACPVAPRDVVHRDSRFERSSEGELLVHLEGSTFDGFLDGRFGPEVDRRGTVLRVAGDEGAELVRLEVLACVRLQVAGEGDQSSPEWEEL